MKLLCEVMVTEILPSVSALVAKDLMENHGLNQVQVSKKLGITQPAISQYIRKLRGHKVKFMESNKEIVFSIKSISKKIVNEELEEIETGVFCTICKKMRDDYTEFEKVPKFLKCKV